MLEDWEQQELASIERELGTDKGLARMLAGPSRARRHWPAVRRHYPGWFLGCAVTYMLLAMSGALLRTLVEALWVGIAVWLFSRCARQVGGGSSAAHWPASGPGRQDRAVSRR